MEIRVSNSATNINYKNRQKKFGHIGTSYSNNESTFRNKVIRKNCSLKTFHKNNLKLSNIINSNSSKAQSDHRVATTLSANEIQQIKSAILQKFNENKNNTVENRSNYTNHTISNSSNIKKRNKINSNDKILNRIKKKFEKYNKENMAYNIYHDYQKLNFNNIESEKYNFIERMELYSIKRNLKDKTINEYIRLNSPKLPNSKRNQIFENLFNDADNRKIKKEIREKEEYNFLKLNESNNKLKSKKVNEKEINEIVKRLSKPKRSLIYYNIMRNNKIDDNNNKKGNGGKNKENKNKNKIKNNITKSNSMKSIKKDKQISNINNRLYYKEIDKANKKDIAYILYKQKVNKLLGVTDNINNVKPQSKDSKDCISYEQFKILRNNNNNMINIKSMNNNNNNNIISEKYNFRDEDDSSDNNNNYKNIKANSNKNNNYNELFTFSKPQNKNSINNLKISIMIDNFFCNK